MNNYLSTQLKQFAISSVFVAVAATGLSLTKSFDQGYLAEMNKTEQKVEQKQELEKITKMGNKAKEKKETKKVGAALATLALN